MSQDISCEVEGCKGHALLPGGSILIIDGKRMCWEHGAESKKQKNKCVRVPLTDLQLARDLLSRGLDKLGDYPPEIGKSMSVLDKILNEKGVE